MKFQPNRDYISDDVVFTPKELAKRIVDHFNPQGSILEPCKGNGSFLESFPENSLTQWCEIKEGRDFFDFKGEVDWIITNPPWSQFRKFLQHSMEISKEIVFLVTINHIWTKARLRDLKNNNFGIKEICLTEMPKNFPQSGFQLGVIHLSKNYSGPILFSDISM